MTKRRFFWLTIVIIFLLLVAGVTFNFAFLAKVIRFYPSDGLLTNNSQPEISLSLAPIPFLRAQKPLLFLNDEKLPVSVVKQREKFVAQLKAGIPDGKYKLEANLRVWFLFPRRLKIVQFFTVDTKPPVVTLAGSSQNYLVSTGSKRVVSITSELGATVAVALNNRLLKREALRSDNSLKVKLSGLKSKNKLVVQATDKAGNLVSVTVPVIIDRKLPVIVEQDPVDNETVRRQDLLIKVRLQEGETGLKEARLLLDGKEVNKVAGGKSATVSYFGNMLVDGEHTATVEALDYANHKMVHQWKFKIDTRLIVVDRSQKRLYFYRNGQLQKTYPVAVGMPAYPTPAGHYRIIYRIKNPIWINPKSPWSKDMPDVIPAGPGNPLGTRALALNARAVFIHGTYTVSSIGRAASHGCIRMRITDSEELYNRVVPGTPVDIIN
jgi:hypothetical protein